MKRIITIIIFIYMKEFVKLTDNVSLTSYIENTLIWSSTIGRDCWVRKIRNKIQKIREIVLVSFFIQWFFPLKFARRQLLNFSILLSMAVGQYPATEKWESSRGKGWRFFSVAFGKILPVPGWFQTGYRANLLSLQ